MPYRDIPSTIAENLAWLRLQAWENARADFVTARKKKEDIVSRFQSEFGSVLDFEREVGVRMPGDITALLTTAAGTHSAGADIAQIDVRLPGSTRTVQGIAAR